MNILVIVAHPQPSSFNHAIAQSCVRALEANGHRVVTHDLYAEEFEAILPYEEFGRDVALPAQIQQHCDEVARADGIIIVHPNWWGQPPAILKGWVDRIFRPGVAYEFLEGDQGEGAPRGLLRASQAVVFNTSNTEGCREQAVFGDPLETIWRNCVFGLCGVQRVYRRMFSVVVTSTAAERQGWLDEAAATMDRLFPKEYLPEQRPR